MTDQETLDAIGRAQNSLLEEGECVHHHACRCVQDDIAEAVALLRSGKDIDAEHLLMTRLMSLNSDLETP